MQGAKMLTLCPRFLLYEEVHIYWLPGSGWWLPYGSACQYLSASYVGSTAGTDIFGYSSEMRRFKKYPKPTVA